MSLVGILIFMVFVALLIKAICETIYGICLLICSLFWHVVSCFLLVLIMVLRCYKRLRPRPKQAPPRRNPVVAGLAYAFAQSN